jgi:hypothetical protein
VIRPLAGSLAAISLVAGCLFPDRGTAIANEIRALDLPIVQSIEYNGDEDASGPALTILLRPGVSREEARAFACDIVVPAVERGSPPEEFVFDVLDSTGSDLYASEATDCS